MMNTCPDCGLRQWRFDAEHWTCPNGHLRTATPLLAGPTPPAWKRHSVTVATSAATAAITVVLAHLL